MVIEILFSYTSGPRNEVGRGGVLTLATQPIMQPISPGWVGWYWVGLSAGLAFDRRNDLWKSMV